MRLALSQQKRMKNTDMRTGFMIQQRSVNDIENLPETFNRAKHDILLCRSVNEQIKEIC